MMLTVLAQVGSMLTAAGLAWAGLAAVSVPIVIHLLTRFRRRPQVWGAMRFLIEAYRRHRTRLQLEQWLLLATRCLILALLGLALAGPMLSGCGSGPLGALTGSGRLVYLVIDDSLTSHAEYEQTARFEHLRGTAMALVDGLRLTDRVGVWRTARPSEALLAEATLDHGSARQLIESMRPRYSRSDLNSALSQVREALLNETASARQETMVIVLSDFSRSALAVDRPAPAELAALGDHAQLLLMPPMTGRGNVQIVSLRPRRHMIVADRGATAAMEVRLRRFGDEAADRLSVLQVGAIGADDQRGETIERQVRWVGGQDEAVVHVEVPLPDLSPFEGDRAAGGWALAVHARLSHGGEDEADALAADNEAWAVVQLRRRLAVGLIDTTARSLGERAIEPRQWLTLALAPLDDGPNGQVERVELSPTTVDAQSLSTLDAVMVLRPDLLPDQGWSALSEFTRRGGLSWVFVPASGEAVSGVWGGKLTEFFDLDWRIGLETLEAPAGGAWTLLSDGDRAVVPGALRLLAADWGALMQPIRIVRRVALQVGSDEGAGESVWLRLNDESRSALLASAAVGDGRVLMLATALDPQWNNVTTKPLFVPLIHEALRGVLGESPQVRRLSLGRAGDRPLLDRAWEAVPHVALMQGLAADDTPAQVMLQRDEGGVMPVSALREPGVWRGAFGSQAEGGLLLAMNVDADAGDTRALEAGAVQAWFQSVAQVQWLDDADPAAALATQSARIALGWPLLFVVLGLVLLETAMARWFSHATTKGEI